MAQYNISTPDFSVTRISFFLQKRKDANPTVLFSVLQFFSIP